jgi:hypothetical protein
MYLCVVKSDRLYTWSDICASENLFRLAKTPPISAAATAPTHRHPAWLAYRALQALWQARLQVCRRSGARSQVLPVGKLSGLSTTHGLCAAGVLRPSHRIPRQLPTNPRDFRGNLRDQPRTITASRGALRSHDGRRTFRVHRTVGNGNRCRSPGQYARSLARQRTKRFGIRGDNR